MKFKLILVEIEKSSHSLEKIHKLTIDDIDFIDFSITQLAI